MSREMKTPEILKILGEARQLGCENLTLTGGEPLLRKDFFDIFRYAGELGFRIRLFTNASLLSPDHIELFRKNPCLERIEITLYGMKTSSYGKVTGNPGAFRSVLKGIALLKENRIPFLLNFAVLPWNESDMAAFMKFADESGVTESASYVMLFNKRVRRDSVTADQVIENLRISPENAVRFLSQHQPDHFSDLSRFLAETAGPQEDLLFRCGAGLGSGAIDAYGWLTPCLLIKTPSLSCNLRQVSLKKAMTEFFSSLRKMQAQNSSYIERCGRCFLKSLCEQCPAKAWIESGEIDQPVEYFCRVTHAQAEHLELIHPGESAWKVEDWKERIRRLLTVAGGIKEDINKGL
jgi:radical SAM protein with 4Fe4S-binding SPASM domain